VQTPWEEGVAGWALARALGARFVPQLHFDLFAPTFVREHPLNGWRRMVAGRVLRGGDVVRVVSAGLRESVVRELGVSAARVRVVPVGVRFVPADGPAEAHRAALFPGLPADAPVVLYVGKFHPRKNLPLWIEAARRVAAEVPAVRFVLAGDGPDEAAVRGLAAAAGIAAHFVGVVGYERLPALFAAADVFMLASDNEGFGRVVVEAGLAGVPAVATDCPGPRELLEEGGGVLVPRGDAGALAAAVTGLLRDPAARRAMGDAARVRMRETFGTAALTERLLACWEAAAAGGRS
jgi:glycosyltransferase involved in cell wall biosynthesis